MTPTADRATGVSPQRGARGTPQSGPADISPTDIRIRGGKRDRTIRKGRLIITDQWLYVCDTANAGKDVISVTRLPHPEGERVVFSGNRGAWGNLTWNPCGCANSWSRHTKQSLIDRGDAAAS